MLMKFGVLLCNLLVKQMLFELLLVDASTIGCLLSLKTELTSSEESLRHCSQLLLPVAAEWACLWLFSASIAATFQLLFCTCETNRYLSVMTQSQMCDTALVCKGSTVVGQIM